MEVTEILQSCTAVTIDEILRYRISMAVLSKGELPHPNIFLYLIQNADNPGSDQFTRVANVEDIQNVKLSREAAIAAGETYYLAMASEYYYDNVNTAVSAKEALTTRINELINTWITYQDGFINTDGLTIHYPTTDPGYEQALKDAYKDARDARIAAEVAVTSADATVTSAQTALDYEKQKYKIYKDTCALITVVWNPVGGELATYRTKIETGGDEGTEAASYWPTVSGHLDELRNAVCNQIPIQAGVVSNAEDSVSSALTAKEEASVTLSTAQAAEDEALAAVLAVCPSFDPASV